MKIKTRKDLVRILTEGWKNEVSVNINGISFLTNETKLYFDSTTDKTPNNFIKIHSNDGTFIGGIIATNIVSIFTSHSYEVVLC